MMRCTLAGDAGRCGAKTDAKVTLHPRETPRALITWFWAVDAHALSEAVPGDTGAQVGY